MIPMPSSTQVWLATGYTDMRRYVERMIMQSPRQEEVSCRGFRAHSLGIIRLACGRAEHGQQLVGCIESAWLQHRRCHCGKRLQLVCRISSQIDFGSLQVGVSEPKRHFADVTGGLQRVHGAGVS
jgi:hypothetical protein